MKKSRNKVNKCVTKCYKEIKNVMKRKKMIIICSRGDLKICKNTMDRIVDFILYVRVCVIWTL